MHDRCEEPCGSVTVAVGQGEPCRSSSPCPWCNHGPTRHTYALWAVDVLPTGAAVPLGVFTLILVPTSFIGACRSRGRGRTVSYVHAVWLGFPALAGRWTPRT